MKWINYNGCNLRCKEGFLTWKRHNKCGCGPGELGNRIVPDSILGVSIKIACCIHDHIYRTSSTESNKILADLELFGNSIRIINQKSKNKFMSFLRAVIISWYFLAVFYGGGYAYSKKHTSHQ